MDEQAQSDALLMLLIVHCSACSWLRGKVVGDQGEKQGVWGPLSYITDVDATLKAAEKQRKKFSVTEHKARKTFY